MSGSSSDTISFLNKTFSRHDLTHDALAQLRLVLGQFVERHSDTDELPSSRVQEELRRICNDSLGTEASKLEAFILALTMLEPYLSRTGNLLSWFELVISTMLDAEGTKKDLFKQTEDFVLTSVAFDKDATDASRRSSTSKILISKLIQEFLKRTKALSDGIVATTVRAQNRSQQELQALVVQVGRRHPQELFSSLEEPLLNPTTRFHALELLSAWLKQQHPHLHVVAETSVVDILLKCLMNDRSTMMISIALQCLLMLLPHIPATVASQLPRLFLIYSRCLCWEKFSASSSMAQRNIVTDDTAKDESDDEHDQLFSIDPSWQVVISVPDVTDSPAPELLSYFTYLYGLYPLNFTNYIRKPRKYLKQIDFPGAEDFDLDQNIIRSRTEQYQSAHLLHSNFFNITPEEELVDNRWLKAEPAEVVAECLGLYSGNYPFPPVSHSALDGTLPVLPASPTSSQRPELRLAERKHSQDSGLLPQSPSSASLAPSMESALSKPSTTATLNNDTIFLQRELMVIRNELNFERHLKQQHAAAIGQLKRDRIKAVTVEAETATLINTNRTLVRKLTEATKFNEKLQKETQSRKTYAMQRDDQLNAKIRSLRSALVDQEALEASLSKAHADIEVLRQLVVESESRERRMTEQVASQAEATEELRQLRQQLQECREREAETSSGGVRLERELEDSRALALDRQQENQRLKDQIADFQRRLSAIGVDGVNDDIDSEHSKGTAMQHDLEEARAKYDSIQRGWIKANRELQDSRNRYDDLLRALKSRRVGGILVSSHATQLADDKEDNLWSGPPVGGINDSLDGEVGEHRQGAKLEGSFPSNRPSRVEVLEQRIEDRGLLSRSEDSSRQRGAPSELDAR